VEKEVDVPIIKPNEDVKMEEEADLNIGEAVI